MGGWEHGRVEAWEGGSMGGWEHGRVVAWEGGSMGGWEHGSMGGGAGGRVGWGRGRVGVGLREGCTQPHGGVVMI